MKICFYTSNMQSYYVNLDAAYLVTPKIKVELLFTFIVVTTLMKFLKNPINSPMHVECKVSPHVITSATEAETVGLFFNYQTAIYLCRILTALGHPQRPTLVKTDNDTAS